ncbi:hypothetical protein Tco_1120803 [Tanacetum coccineum]
MKCIMDSAQFFWKFKLVSNFSHSFYHRRVFRPRPNILLIAGSTRSTIPRATTRDHHSPTSPPQPATTTPTIIILSLSSSSQPPPEEGAFGFVISTEEGALGCNSQHQGRVWLWFGDKVMLKVSPWKGVVHFGKRGKLNPRYVGPFKVIERVGEVAYKLELLEELTRVHNTFHVSNLKKCHADEPLAVPLDGLNLDDQLHFVEEPVEIVGREVKRLKRSRIPLVKVRWNTNR